MLKARWKGGVSSGAAKRRLLALGQIRSFRIGRWSRMRKKIDLELA